MPQEEQKSIPQVVSELKDLTVDYAKQETIDPLKNLTRFIGVGIPSLFMVGLGVAMLGLALLRGLQTETGSRFTGNWSWLPYLLAALPLAIGAGLSVRAIFTEERRARERREAAR